MTNYLIRFDNGPCERFQAIGDRAAREYVREILFDEGAEEGDGGALYRTDEGGRGDEDYIGDVRLGEGEDETGEAYLSASEAAQAAGE
jgi:hypothetical protein